MGFIAVRQEWTTVALSSISCYLLWLKGLNKIVLWSSISILKDSIARLKWTFLTAMMLSALVDKNLKYFPKDWTPVKPKE